MILLNTTFSQPIDSTVRKLVYTPKEIGIILDMLPKSVYRMLETHTGLAVLRPGNRGIRVLKASFDAWFNQGEGAIHTVEKLVYKPKELIQMENSSFYGKEMEQETQKEKPSESPEANLDGLMEIIEKNPALQQRVLEKALLSLTAQQSPR